MKERLLDVFWPRKCELCGGDCDRPARYICAECLNRMPFVNTKGCCKVCGRAIELYEGEFVCNDCKGRDKPRFDRAGSSLRFEDPARRMILDYKFNFHIWLRPDFVDFMEATALARFDVAGIDALVSVPSSIFHRIDRGYNQASCFAKDLAARLGKPYIPLVAMRRLFLKRQSKLDETERKENAKDSFFILRPGRVAGKTVLAVDDIMTTGATLSDYARALKEAGAAKVFCVTLARSLR